MTAILLTAAIFTKQSYALAAPMAAFVWLLREAPRKRAFELALWTGGLSLGLFLVLTLITGGGFFTNIVTANVNPFYWNTVKDNANTIRSHLPLLVLGAIIFLALGWIKKLNSPAWWLAAPYLVGATLSGMTIGKTGSNINYLMEFAAALSLAAGALVAWAGKRWWLQALILLLLAFQMGVVLNWTKSDHQGWADVKFYQASEIAQMTELVRNAQGQVLADEYMGVIPLAGKALYFQPFEFKQMAGAGIWDEGPFLEQIRQKKFALIILYEPQSWDSRKERWTPAQLQAIEDNYGWAGQMADAVIYKPR